MNIEFSDEELCKRLNNVISGLLPHENYLPQNFTTIYPALQTVISTEDARDVYFAVFTILDKYMSLAINLQSNDFKVNITRERFIAALENNLPDLILEPQLNLREILASEGKSADITIPTVQQEAMAIVYEKTVAVYDRCYTLARTLEDAISELVPLKDCLVANVIETGLQTQRAIMSVGAKVGRRTYRGSNGWLEYSMGLARDITDLSSEGSNTLLCDSLDILDQVEADTQEMAEPIGDYGIPEIDDCTPMLKHRLMVLVALQNTGKTMMCINWIASLIRKDVKVFFACGESVRSKIFLQVVSSYIFQEYGLFFEVPSLTGEGLAELSDTNRQIVSVAKTRVATSGLAISDDLQYDTVSSEITKYAQLGYEAFFLDHTRSLKGAKGRPIGELVARLALDCRELKKQFPIFIGLMSQASSALKDLLQKGDELEAKVTVTAASAVPQEEADELFILSRSDYLKKQGLVSFSTFKRRDGPAPRPVYLKTEYQVASFVYDAKYQGADTIDGSALGRMLDDLGDGDAYVSEEDSDGLSIDF